MRLQAMRAKGAKGRAVQVSQRRGRCTLVTDKGAVVEEADRFLRAVEARNVSALTVRAYAYDLLSLYRWLVRRGPKEARRVEELKHSDLLEFIGFEKGRWAQPASVNRRLVVANLFYRFLTGRRIGATGEAGVNLAGPYYKGRGKDRELGLQRIKPLLHRALRLKTPRTVVEPLAVHQVRLLMASFSRYRDIALAYLMLLCGLRSREVISLGLCDVDFDEHRLLVKGKGDNERVLPLPPIILGCLRDYLRFERPSWCKTGALLVVLQGVRRGRAMTTSGLRSLFRHRRRHSKLRNANPHRLRHTFGSDMARAGVRLPILQKMMGHQDSRMTLKYIHLSMADVAAEFERALEQIRKRYGCDESK